jgi:hypothetical protein
MINTEIDFPHFVKHKMLNIEIEKRIFTKNR